MKKENDLDFYAPILPDQGLANLKLRKHIKEYYHLIDTFYWLDPKTYEDCSASLHSPFHVAYEMKDTLVMVFHILNGKLMKMIALSKYQGSLFEKLRVGMPIENALKVEPRLYYDEDEEMYFIKYIQGVSIETDINNEYIQAITVYIKELDEFENDLDQIETFEKGNW